jgi:enolase
MSQIEQVRARQILDSRGNPTVEVELSLESGAWSRVSVAAGATKGAFEASELRDGEASWLGQGVTKAVGAVNGEIADAIHGMESGAQAALDRTLGNLDGTREKSRLGANAILAVSLAAAHASAAEEHQPLWRYLGGGTAQTLPVPLLSVLGAAPGNGIDLQDIMIVPVGAASFSEALRMASAVYRNVEAMLRERGLSTAVNDEGAFVPHLEAGADPLELLLAAIQAAGYAPGEQVAVAIDAAATGCQHGDHYELGEEHRQLDAVELTAYWTDLVNRYPLISIEDGMAEEDWTGWKTLSDGLGRRVQLVGDDLFATSAVRLRQGIDGAVANAILIKPGQVGTLTETMDAIRTARDAGYTPVISHRGGETEDVSIADLAVACGCPQIKAGAPARTDRVAKYNQLLRIEEALGDDARYPGRAAFAASHM